MKTKCHSSGIVLAALLGANAGAQPTDVTFFDGGYSEMCSTAARNIHNPIQFTITGSRVDIPPLEICNLAIREGGSRDGGLAASYTNRGVIHFAQGNIDAAMADFDEAVRLDDTMAQAYVNRGYILNSREQWAESVASFDRGIEAGVTYANTAVPAPETPAGAVPEIARAHYNRAIAHEELGHAREAYLDYLKASELAPEWTQPQEELKRFSVTRR